MLECSSQECVTARANLEAARNKIYSLCTELSYLKVQRDFARSMAILYGSFAAAMASIAVAIAAFSLIPGVGIVAGIFFVLAATFLALQAASLLRIASLNAQINETKKQLDEARKDFQTAVSEVIRNCPPDCWGDITMPKC